MIRKSPIINNLTQIETTLNDSNTKLKEPKSARNNKRNSVKQGKGQIDPSIYPVNKKWRIANIIKYSENNQGHYELVVQYKDKG